MGTARAVAIDFAGTMTTQERGRPHGAVVRQVLADDYGITVPDGFVAAYDLTMWRYYVESLAGSLGRLLLAVATDQGIGLPPVSELEDRLWAACGDHPVDPAAAQAVKRLHAAGLRCVLASNTCRPAPLRAATLDRAGLGFMRVVCSSDVGYAKPMPGFYQAVVKMAGVPADDIVFVGDNLLNDVTAPLEEGGIGRAVWVRRKADPSLEPQWMADGTLVLSRLGQLTVDHVLRPPGESVGDGPGAGQGYRLRVV